MMKTILSVVSVLLINFLTASAQNVTNIDYNVEGNKVVVTYDLDSEADVYMFASTAATEGWNTSYMNYSAYRAMAPALRAVSGDVGKNVQPGHNKIIWYYKEEVAPYFAQDPATGLGTFAVYTAAWEKKIREKRSQLSQDEADRYTMTSLAPELFNSMQIKVLASPTTPEPEMVYIDGCDGLGDFWMGKYEVSVKEFSDFVKATNYVTDAEKSGYGEIWSKSKNDYENKKGVNWRHDEYGNLRPEEDYPDYPVVNVSYNDARAYCDWLTKNTNKLYMLPSWEDWLDVAAGLIPGHTIFDNLDNISKFSGSNNADDVAWFIENSECKIHKRGFKAPNAYHIYDMSGNVAEWNINNVDVETGKCSLGYQESNLPNVFGSGGSCFEKELILESCTRNWPKSSVNVNVGFRVVMAVQREQNWITGKDLKADEM